MESIRQVGLEKAREDVLYVHVTLLPFISGSNQNQLNILLKNYNLMELNQIFWFVEVKFQFQKTLKIK